MSSSQPLTGIFNSPPYYEFVDCDQLTLPTFELMSRIISENRRTLETKRDSQIVYSLESENIPQKDFKKIVKVIRESCERAHFSCSTKTSWRGIKIKIKNVLDEDKLNIKEVPLEYLPVDTALLNENENLGDNFTTLLNRIQINSLIYHKTAQYLSQLFMFLKKKIKNNKETQPLYTYTYTLLGSVKAKDTRNPPPLANIPERYLYDTKEIIENWLKNNQLTYQVNVEAVDKKIWPSPPFNVASVDIKVTLSR